MKKIIAIITVLIFTNCSTEKNQAQTQKFNTEAISKFWEITAYLKRDHTLNDMLWNSYYNLKGNKNYIEHNRSKESAIDHRKFLELVFRSSLSDSLQKVIRSKKYKNNDIFQNLIYIKNNEKALKKYTKTITSSAYFKECIALSKKFLPKGKYQKIPKDLVIYIQAFTYDAAVQENSMYFGLSVVHDFDKLQKGAVAAHEFHHILRQNKEFKNSLSVKDSASYSMINQINNEGIADLIDKEIIAKYPKKNTNGNNV